MPHEVARETRPKNLIVNFLNRDYVFANGKVVSIDGNSTSPLVGRLRMQATGSQLCSAEKPNFAILFFGSLNFSSKNFEFPFSSNIAVKKKVHEKANILIVAFFSGGWRGQGLCLGGNFPSAAKTCQGLSERS